MANSSHGTSKREILLAICGVGPITGPMSYDCASGQAQEGTAGLTSAGWRLAFPLGRGGHGVFRWSAAFGFGCLLGTDLLRTTCVGPCCSAASRGGATKARGASPASLVLQRAHRVDGRRDERRPQVREARDDDQESGRG